MLNRRRFLGAAGSGLVSPLVLRRARAQEFRLRFHPIPAPQTAAREDTIEPWVERIEEESDGRIEIAIEASAPTGDIVELVRQVRTRAVDIAWIANAYPPALFPRTEVLELPGVHNGNLVAANLAVRELLDPYLRQDYEGMHVVTLHVHAGNGIQMRDIPVRSPADLAGKRMHVTTRSGAWVAESLGATPVVTAVGDLPLALSTGLADGCFLPWESIPALKLEDLTQYEIEGPGHERFGTTTFRILMNQEAWSSMPRDLQQVVDRNSGNDFAFKVGQIWRDAEDSGIKAAIDAGNELITLTEDEMMQFRAAMEPVHLRWIREVTAAGIDGQALYDAARAAVAKHEQ